MPGIVRRTTLTASGTGIVSETAWNDGSQGGASGGGYSSFFATPSWQTAQAGQTGRGVPDVAGNAAPETGYNVLVDGQQDVIGGTSAVAPLWAGLVALLNQKLQTRLGFINPALYSANQATCFHDITQGDNGAYNCGPGWDAVTGLGSPDGIQLLQTAFSKIAQAQNAPAAAEVRSQRSTGR